MSTNLFFFTATILEWKHLLKNDEFKDIIELVSLPVIKQKMDYIHTNPIHPKWNLAQTFLDYKYSSARFNYEGIDDFGFLSNIGEEDV